MQCQVLKPFNRRGEPQLPGSIIEVPEGMLSKLAGYVRAIATADSYQQAQPDAPQEPSPEPDMVTPGLFVCRACGSTNWRQGIVSRICTDCEVPEKI